MKNIRKIMFLVLVAALGGLSSLQINRYFFHDSQSYNSNGAPLRQAAYEFKNITVPSFDFADVSEAVTPTVVYIKSTINEKDVDSDAQSNKRGGSRQKSPQDLFGDMFREMPRGPQEGSGSGVILSSDGYIVTNNHVVEDADDIEVVLHDKRAYKAEVVAKDPNTDLALIKINVNDLTPIKIGNSDHLRVGEWVLAVGNPFNLTSTVTAGIVSAKGRSLSMLGGGASVESFIQTDAAVNPGNSGGALINSKGELVGINTAIASQTGSYAGYSFAIPVNLMNKVVKDFREFGEVQRGFIGIQIQEVDAKLADKEKLINTKGVFVNGLTEKGAAENAGIKKGDVILKVEGHDVNTVSELQEIVAGHRPGDEISVLVERESISKELKVILRNKDGKTGSVVSASKELRKSLGAEFEMVSDAEKSRLKIGNGVKIKSLSSGKLKDAGLSTGAIITGVDKQGVYSTNDVYRLIEGKKGAVMVEGYDPNGDHKYRVLELGNR